MQQQYCAGSGRDGRVDPLDGCYLPPVCPRTHLLEPRSSLRGPAWADLKCNGAQRLLCSPLFRSLDEHVHEKGVGVRRKRLGARVRPAVQDGALDATGRVDFREVRNVLDALAHAEQQGQVQRQRCGGGVPHRLLLCPAACLASPAQPAATCLTVVRR